MILIRATVTLWVLFFTCGKNIVTTMRSGIFLLVAAVCHYVAILLAVVELIKKMNYFIKNKRSTLMEQ
jgi:hypothetical protein